MADFLSKLARNTGQKGSKARFVGARKAQIRSDDEVAIFNGTSSGTSAIPLDPEQESKNELGAAGHFLKGRGFFDEIYYSTTYPDVVAVGADLFEHFFLYGFKEGCRTNSIFDPIWYLATYLHVEEEDVQPLLHYALSGEQGPGPYLQPAWCREKYKVPANESAVAHYLKIFLGPHSPISEFGRLRAGPAAIGQARVFGQGCGTRRRPPSRSWPPRSLRWAMRSIPATTMAGTATWHERAAQRRNEEALKRVGRILQDPAGLAGPSGVRT